ncbi:MAG: 4-hydroxy-tetrahydrodipicolinate synthase [Roseburia sp.]|nr:4-hydroxy-tetrahydrodipicolinate synthase [Anaeroplasma bactoclasticum]MCM1196147.1 4-hydroxy-tetrahydrodipicolinate synthase [Roseburia sp.]MCM1557637.1 4-hydroxy-tetrahydrodipicolinate synthase [Anaeroplasma bactoclasticum]
MLRGSIVALVTPFNADNEIDYNEVKRLLEFHLENQTDGILLLGTTAEAESLSDCEKQKLVEYVLEYLNGKIKVMVGIISNVPNKAIEMAELFSDLDIDSYLVSAPYYIKSNTEGLLKHFTYIADHVNHPIVLYNVPKRTGVHLSEEVVRFLSYHPNIVGIKEASGDLAYQTKIALLCNKNFVLYGADDLSMIPSLGLGAVGIISVINNAFPKEVKLIIDSFDKDRNISILTYKKISKLTEDIYKESSPIPIKYLLFVMGFKTRKLRLPLAEASIGLRRRIEEDYLAFVDED